MFPDSLSLIQALTFYHTVNNQLQVCTLNFVCSGTAGGGSTAAQLGAAVYAKWRIFIQATCNTALTIYGYTVRPLGSLGSNVHLTAAPVTATSGVTGSLATLQTPTQVRAVASWTTALVGRKFRGRNYLPSPDASMLTPATGYPVAAYQAAWVSVQNLLIPGPITVTNGGTTSSWDFLLLHRPKKVVPPAIPGNWTGDLITAGKPITKFGTQRKSGEYGRPNGLPF